MGGLSDVIESSAKDLSKIIGTSAPLLASVLGGPLAGVAVSLLANAFSVNPNSINELTTKIANDPEAAIKIKTLEYEHVETLARIASSDFNVETADKQNARLYGSQYKDFLRHMAYLITVGFFGALIILFSPLPLNPDARELLSMLVGMLVSKWQTIIDFFYGSSHPNNQQDLKK